VVDTAPMVHGGRADGPHKTEFQRFTDFATAAGTLPRKVDITKYLQVY
jgi:hypothetical protein